MFLFSQGKIEKISICGFAMACSICTLRLQEMCTMTKNQDMYNPKESVQQFNPALVDYVIGPLLLPINASYLSWGTHKFILDGNKHVTPRNQ